MNKWFKTLIVATGSVLLLGGCSMFGDDDDVVVMAELVNFEPSYQPKIAWSKSVGDGVRGYFSQLQPAVDEDSIFIANRNGVVKSLDKDKGSLNWSIDLSDDPSNKLNKSARLSGGVSIAMDTIFVGSENAQVFALDKNTGETKWVAEVTGEVISDPVYSSGLVVVHTSRGDLFALDSATGKQVWILGNKVPRLTLRGSSTPAIYQGGIVYGSANGLVSVALLESGRAIWSLPAARPHGATELDRISDSDMEPVISNGIVYTLAYNGTLIAIDLLKGEQLWASKYSGYSELALSGNSIFLTDADGYVYSVDRVTGKEIWKNTELFARNLTGVTVANEYIVVGDEEGYLHWLDRDNGHFVARQNLDGLGLYMAPVATQTHLYLQTRSGKLIAIEKPIVNKK